MVDLLDFGKHIFFQVIVGIIIGTCLPKFKYLKYLPPTVPLLYLRNRACHRVSYTTLAKMSIARRTDIETSTTGASCIFYVYLF